MTGRADTAGDGFLSRWARRKEQVRHGDVVAPEPAAAVPPMPDVPVVNILAPVPTPETCETPVAEPPPTLADVALLTRDSDYSRFTRAGVDEGVKRAAMKKLFADPHFNLMDGLDTYIGDYGKPDPIPLAMLRQMNQSKFLRLFDEDKERENEAKPVVDATADPVSPTDEDADLRLQQDDAAGRPAPDRGAGA